MLVISTVSSAMHLDKRTFCVGVLAALAAACAVGPAPGDASDSVTWAGFRARFVDRSGRLVDNGNGGISHSEGQGYAMLLAVRAGDRRGFNSLWTWTRRHLANAATGLHAWRYDPNARRKVADLNNATDGDILIAWALGEAGRRWDEPAYLAAATALRASILARCTIEVAKLRLLLPGMTGFVQPDYVTLNPAYYVWPALDAFHALAPAEGWERIIRDGETLVARARFGPDALPVDWIDVAIDGTVRPAQGRDPRFGFDAVRVPLYAVLGGRLELVRPVQQFWQGLVTRRQPLPAWIDVVSGAVAPYAASPGLLAVAARLTSSPRPSQLSSDYYAAVLQMLADIPAVARAGD